MTFNWFIFTLECHHTVSFKTCCNSNFELIRYPAPLLPISKTFNSCSQVLPKNSVLISCYRPIILKICWVKTTSVVRQKEVEMAFWALPRGAYGPQTISQQPTHLGSMWPGKSLGFQRTCFFLLWIWGRNTLIRTSSKGLPIWETGTLPTHPSKVVGRSPKDEKTRESTFWSEPVTSRQGWGNRFQTQPAKPTLIYQLILSTVEITLTAWAGPSLPRSRTLNTESHGSKTRTLASPQDNGSGCFLLVAPLPGALSILWAQSCQTAGGPSNVWLPHPPLHMLASLLGSIHSRIPPLLTFCSHC